jgi:hypothetical protein
MSTVFQTRAQLEQSQANKEHAERVRIALDECYSTRFDGKVLRPTTATRNAIIEACAWYHSIDPSVCVPSVQTLQELYKIQRQDFIKAFPPSLLIPVEQARKEIIDEILMAYRIARPSITEFELQQSRGQLSNGNTLGALRNKLRYTLEAIRLARKTAPELREEIQQTRAAAAPLPTQLPDDLTPKALRQKLATMSRSETDRFIARYGLEKINARLQGRDSFVEVPQ